MIIRNLIWCLTCLCLPKKFLHTTNSFNRSNKNNSIFSMPELNANSMRVLIFKDCDRKGDKSLVFDSDAVQLTVY